MTDWDVAVAPQSSEVRTQDRVFTRVDSLMGNLRWTQDFGQVAKIGSCS